LLASSVRRLPAVPKPTRLELLEELVAAVARWSADGHDRRLPGVLDAFNAIIELDNDD